MTLSLYDLLKRDIKKMLVGIGKKGKGNIYPLVIKEVEHYIIKLVLKETNFNYLLTSKMLGISRSTLYRKIKALDILSQKTRRKSK